MYDAQKESQLRQTTGFQNDTQNVLTRTGSIVQPNTGTCNSTVTFLSVTSPASVNKQFEVQANGSLSKTSSATVTAATTWAYDLGTAQGMASLLAQATSRTDAVLMAGNFTGVELQAPANLVTEKAYREATGVNGVIATAAVTQNGLMVARKKEAVTPSAWILMDADTPPGMPQEWAALDIKGRLALLESIVPGISKAERVELKSSSARVAKPGDVKLKTHAWMRVNDPSKLDILKAHVKIQSGLKRLSFQSPIYSATGEVLRHADLALLDTSVWVTGRLVFVAAPTISASMEALGYQVTDASIQIINEGAGALDLTNIVAPSQADVQAYSALVQKPMSLSVSANGMSLTEQVLDLTDSIEIEVEENGFVRTTTMAELYPKYRGTNTKLRCQTPFRSSVSMAGLIRFQESGEVILHDVGDGSNHIYTVAVSSRRADVSVFEHAALEVMPPSVMRDMQAATDRAAELAEAKARREAQRQRNLEIGEGSAEMPTQKPISLDEMINDYAMVAGDSKTMVVNMKNPKYAMAFNTFKDRMGASIRVEGKKKVEVTADWRSATDRKTFEGITFRPGHGESTIDPNNKISINTWRPFVRNANANVSIAQPFIDHVKWLFTDRSEDFLDWLAHIEQEPGVLPHTAWLHVSETHGTGRNWLVSVLTRVWAGQVAAAVDLSRVMGSSFNGNLAGKILANVDEVKLGSTNYSEAEKLRQMVTATSREINNKYGANYIEWNFMRWLVFSNYKRSIPVEDKDRRWEVQMFEGTPKDAAYYAHLYSLVESQEFIDAVAAFLLKRDIAKFNPGAHAKHNAARATIILASMSEMEIAAKALSETWPSDIISNNDILTCLGQGVEKNLSAAMANALTVQGAERYPKPISVEGSAKRVWILRNVSKWTAPGVTPAMLGKEASRACKATDWVCENLDGDRYGVAPSSFEGNTTGPAPTGVQPGAFSGMPTPAPTGFGMPTPRGIILGSNTEVEITGEWEVVCDPFSGDVQRDPFSGQPYVEKRRAAPTPAAQPAPTFAAPVVKPTPAPATGFGMPTPAPATGVGFTTPAAQPVPMTPPPMTTANYANFYL